MTDLQRQIATYLRETSIPVDVDVLTGARSESSSAVILGRSRRRWRPVTVSAIAAVAALLIGAPFLVFGVLSPTRVDQEPMVDQVPETWTIYTAAADGIVGDCVCGMAMATDESIWLVALDGVSRFDGTQWERIEPPMPFDSEALPSIVASPDGSVWVSGGNYVAQYADGAWGPVVEAGYGEDEGDPWSYRVLDVDVAGRIWVNLADRDGVIEDGVFIPRDWSEFVDDEPVSTGFAEPEGAVIHATDPDGSIWMSIGDSIIGVEGALIEFDGERFTAYDLGGVAEVAFEADGTGWFLVPQVGPDAWMWGQEQWSDPGLYRLEHDEWYRITTADGLAGYRLSGILHAPDGSLWISTVDGTVTHYQPGSDPLSGSPVQVESRPFTDADWPAYPPTTTVGG